MTQEERSLSYTTWWLRGMLIETMVLLEQLDDCRTSIQARIEHDVLRLRSEALLSQEV